MAIDFFSKCFPFKQTCVVKKSLAGFIPEKNQPPWGWRRRNEKLEFRFRVSWSVVQTVKTTRGCKSVKIWKGVLGGHCAFFFRQFGVYDPMVVVGCCWWCLCLLLLCAFFGGSLCVLGQSDLWRARVLRRPVIPCSCAAKSHFFVHTVVWLF